MEYGRRLLVRYDRPFKPFLLPQGSAKTVQRHTFSTFVAGLSEYHDCSLMRYDRLFELTKPLEGQTKISQRGTFTVAATGLPEDGCRGLERIYCVLKPRHVLQENTQIPERDTFALPVSRVTCCAQRQRESRQQIVDARLRDLYQSASKAKSNRFSSGSCRHSNCGC